MQNCNKLNFLIVSCVFEPEPIVSAQISADIANKLVSLNHNVVVFCPSPSRPYGFEFPEKELARKDPWERITARSFVSPKSNLFGRLLESFTFGVATFLFITFTKQKFDRIYINSWPIFGQLGASLACGLKRIKYFIHIQDIYPESLTKRLKPSLRTILNVILKPIDNFILNKADGIIFISKSMLEYFHKERSYRCKNEIVVRNYQEASLTELNSDYKIDQKMNFMYLGNIGSVSGLEFVIRGFSLFEKELNLIVAGSGSEKARLKKLVILKGYKNIQFWEVPNGKVSEIQSKADIMVLPMVKGSSSTSIPSKLPAYMFSSKPIMALVDTDSDTFKEIKKSGCGWVIPFGEINVFKSLVQTILSIERKVLQKKGEDGKLHAEQYFSKNNNLELLINFISKV